MENQGKLYFEDFIESLSDSVHHPVALLNDKTNANVQPCSRGVPRLNQMVEGLITNKEVADLLASRVKSRESSTKAYPPKMASLLDNTKGLSEDLERLALQYEAIAIRKRPKLKSCGTL